MRGADFRMRALVIMAFCQPIIRHSDQAVMCKVSDTPGATRPANKPNNSISTAWISKASAYSWRTRRRAHCTHSAQQALPSKTGNRNQRGGQA